MMLYHGSMYNQPELMPGFKRTGRLIEWDEIEDNSWLYATTNLDEAIRQGLYSLLSQHFAVKRIASAGKRILIDLYPDQKGQELENYTEFKINARGWFNDFRIYLYSIEMRDSDNWLRNINPNNHLRNEWKTQSTIKAALLHVSAIEPMLWMGRREMTLEFIESGKRPFFLSC